MPLRARHRAGGHEEALKIAQVAEAHLFSPKVSEAHARIKVRLRYARATPGCAILYLSVRDVASRVDP